MFGRTVCRLGDKLAARGSDYPITLQNSRRTTTRASLTHSKQGQALPRLTSSGSRMPASANPLARRMQLSQEPQGTWPPL